jgi:hypothetical protein
MFCLAVAAEGINKNEWIAVGSIPITMLTVGFILPGRRHPDDNRRRSNKPASL